MDDMNPGNQPQHESYRSYGPSDITQPVPPMISPMPQPTNHSHKALRWIAGLAVAAVLAAGGAIAGIDLAGSGSPAGGRGAVLSAALGGASSPMPGGTASAGNPAAQASRAGWALRHLRGLHGEFTVRNGTGGFREIAFERGTIAAVSSKTVTVRAADGTTWTWTLMTNTVVRKDRARSSAANLATGDPVFVGGPERGSVRGARLIIVSENPVASHSGSPQGSVPGPSPSAS